MKRRLPLKVHTPRRVIRGGEIFAKVKKKKKKKEEKLITTPPPSPDYGRLSDSVCLLLRRLPNRGSLNSRVAFKCQRLGKPNARPAGRRSAICCRSAAIFIWSGFLSLPPTPTARAPCPRAPRMRAVDANGGSAENVLVWTHGRSGRTNCGYML